MKVWGLVFILVMTSALSWGGAKPINDYFSNKVVEIEWDEVPNAIRYDLEIYDGKNKSFIKTFVSKTNKFRLNVKMGTYYFRSRIQDRFERLSPWSEMDELIIAPPPSKILTRLPDPPEVYADKETGRFDMNLEWDPVPAIDMYRVVVESPEGRLVKDIIARNTKGWVKLPPGQYRFRVQAVLADGTYGEASESTSVLSVVGAQIQPPTVEILRDPQVGYWAQFRSEVARALFEADVYYQPLEGEGWVLARQLKDLKGPKLFFDSSYKPGLYKVKMRASARKFTPSPWVELDFVIKPTEKQLIVVPREVLAGVADPPPPFKGDKN